MKNMMVIQGYRAVVHYDPEINLFRGEFTGLNGGADFYADNVKALREEGERSLAAFLEVCKEHGITPEKSFSGKFQVRVPETLHQQAADIARTRGQSLNQFVATAIEHEIATNR
ncbi:MAG: toxin-antitoxin system HicB family antitoxin [Alcanivorax sp.]|nr:toxin-antitoxin system HicB family antitoxin [Alcanivorax sp.]